MWIIVCVVGPPAPLNGTMDSPLLPWCTRDLSWVHQLCREKNNEPKLADSGAGQRVPQPLHFDPPPLHPPKLALTPTGGMKVLRVPRTAQVAITT